MGAERSRTATGGTTMRLVFIATGAIWLLILAATAHAEAELAEQPVAETKAAEAAPATGPRVARAIITNAIEDREPIDDVAEFKNDQPIIFFFTELIDLEGETITHRWQLEGKTMAEVPFSVGSPRWRVWSSKNLEPEATGDWLVEVVGADGQVLEATRFTYTPVETARTPVSPAAPNE